MGRGPDLGAGARVQRGSKHPRAGAPIPAFPLGTGLPAGTVRLLPDPALFPFLLVPRFDAKNSCEQFSYCGVIIHNQSI